MVLVVIAEGVFFLVLVAMLFAAVAGMFDRVAKAAEVDEEEVDEQPEVSDRYVAPETYARVRHGREERIS